jgi:hypothetical protein
MRKRPRRAYTVLADRADARAGTFAQQCPRGPAPSRDSEQRDDAISDRSWKIFLALWVPQGGRSGQDQQPLLPPVYVVIRLGPLSGIHLNHRRVEPVGTQQPAELRLSIQGQRVHGGLRW